MQGITLQWRQGQLADADYEQRVEAYWSFQSGGVPTRADASGQPTDDVAGDVPTDPPTPPSV
jgi:hypothetical protein